MVCSRRVAPLLALADNDWPSEVCAATSAHLTAGAVCMLEYCSRDGTRTERVADYILQDVLGTGSFGQVVLGVHHKSQERVAIKVLPKDNTDENAVRRISGEVSTMEKVGAGCPFIVQLYEVLVGRHHIYLVVEYAAGGELFKSMFKPENELGPRDIGTPEREQRARAYFQQLVIGLHWCHKHGVAHRDLKPQNLLLSMNGVLKIADFGLAASFNPDPGLRVSSRIIIQTMCVSPLYMAPEMLCLRNGGSYNAIATDTWGCGSVLYAMLMGRPPFPASTFNELVGLASRPHIHLRLPEHVPRGLAALIRSMLRVDPKQRYNLLQVAQSPWFQLGLAATLSKTPNFRPPEGMAPVGPPTGVAAAHRSSHGGALIGVIRRPIWTHSISILLARRRARIVASRGMGESGSESHAERRRASNDVPRAGSLTRRLRAIIMRQLTAVGVSSHAARINSGPSPSSSFSQERRSRVQVPSGPGLGLAKSQ